MGAATSYLWVPGGLASVTLVISVLLRLRRPRALDGRASIRNPKGGWTIRFSGLERGAPASATCLAYAQLPDLPRP